MSRKTDTTRSKNKATDAPVVWEFRLYVAGKTRKALTALDNLERICEEHLAGAYNIEVIDLGLQPELAADDQIIALPTLVKRLPEPERKIVGDLSNTERVLAGLDLSVKARHEI